MFDSFKNRYIIKGSLKALTAIHIGALEEELKPNGIDNKFLKDNMGMPFIPGSSLKGVCRSFFEKLKRGQDEKVCTVTNLCMDSFKGSKKEEVVKELKKNSKNIEKDLAEYIYDNICIVCKLFGSNQNSSKIMFKDSKVIEDTFTGYEIRNGVTIDRDTHIAVKGNLYEVEVVPAGTTFEFELIAENILDEELKDFMLIIKLLESEMINIGGQTSRGLGSIKLENIQIQKIEPSNLIDALLKGKQKSKTFEETFEEALKAI